jgi:hypothetical protein
VLSAVVSLVDFNDGECGGEGEAREAEECGVDVCPLVLLGWGVRRLEDEDGLDGEAEGGDVEEGVEGEEDERVGEDGGEDEEEEEQEPELG